MPYFLDPTLEDEQNQNPNQVQISGASPTTEKDGTGSTSSTAAPPTGSGFQNLDKYLGTNQSKQLGNQVLGNVSNEISSAKQNQDAASEKFQNQVQTSNKLPSSDQVNQAIANPTGADKTQFQGWLNQSYQGPNSLAENQGDWNQYWSGTNKANTSAQELGTEPGRFTLLDSYFGRPNYSFGQKSLDNLLIQQSGLGKQTRDIQNQATGLNAQGQAQAQNLQNQAALRAGQVEQNRESARAAVGLDDAGKVVTGDQAGALGQQYATVNNELASQNAQRQSQIASLKQDLATGRLSDDELAGTGLTSGQSIYNLGDLNAYATPGADLTRDQTMTPEERSYIQALSDLSGHTDDFASGTAQAATPAYTFDLNRFSNDQAAQSKAYNDAYNALKIFGKVADPSGYGVIDGYGIGGVRGTGSIEGDIRALQDAIEQRKGINQGAQASYIQIHQDMINQLQNLLKNSGVNNKIGGSTNLFFDTPGPQIR